jgi:hypothetical protein
MRETHFGEQPDATQLSVPFMQIALVDIHAHLRTDFDLSAAIFVNIPAVLIFVVFNAIA